MGVLPACKVKNQYTLVFLTIEADPALGKDEVKLRLSTVLKTEKPKDLAVAYEVSAGGYRHAHAVMRFESARRVTALCKKVSMYMHFKKENGKAVSVRAFAPRRGGEGWTDLVSYVTEKKHKIGEVCDDQVEISLRRPGGECEFCHWVSRARGFNLFLEMLCHECPLVGDRPGVDQ